MSIGRQKSKPFGRIQLKLQPPKFYQTIKKPVNLQAQDRRIDIPLWMVSLTWGRYTSVDKRLLFGITIDLKQIICFMCTHFPLLCV